jgi:GT2 family glycosyltransferase
MAPSSARAASITVIVPNWNRRDLLERTLADLRAQTCPAAEIVVVDNGSVDGSVELAKEKGARTIALERNAGFSGAVNRGVREARTEFVAVVNNDVRPAPDWLERLCGAFEDRHAYFATGKLLDEASPERIDGTFDLLSRAACPWRAGSGRPDGPVWSWRRRIRLAPFTATLFRAVLFEKVGLLDERFESYLEDVDFGLRCALAGYAGVYEPAAVARHRGSATLGRWHPDTVRRLARNQVLLAAKHYPARCLLRFGWPLLVGQALWGAVAVRHGRGLAYLRGKLAGAAEFRRARKESAGRRADSGIVLAVLRESEREIHDYQRQTGFDPYWRCYFALAGKP